MKVANLFAYACNLENSSDFIQKKAIVFLKVLHFIYKINKYNFALTIGFEKFYHVSFETEEKINFFVGCHFVILSKSK